MIFLLPQTSKTGVTRSVHIKRLIMSSFFIAYFWAKAFSDPEQSSCYMPLQG